ncbi:MAG: TolC family protein, partial [Thermodesulfobacteriota bacterium]|nr:TolC family protein [Thermodesulfobacteriota bacterium]
MTSRVSAIWLPTVWLFLFVATVMMSGAVALAEGTQEDQSVLSLEQSIAIALERNLEIQVAQEEVLAAQDLKKEATTAFLPSLKAEYTYRRPSEVPYVVFEGRKIDFADRNQYRFTGTIEQPLFTGFANLSNYQLAKLGLDVAKIQLTQVRFDLVLQVKEAYFEILTAERIKEVAEQSVEQLQAELKTAQNFYDVGMSPKIDVLDAEVRLAEAEQQLIRTENALRIAKASFNTILRRSIDEEVEVEDILSYKPYDKPYASCLEVSLKNRPELMEGEKNVASAEKEIALAKSAYYPTLSLSSNYYRAGDDPSVDGSEFEDRENWDIMAAASITFFEWGKTRFAANQKKARLRQAEEALEQIKDAVRLDVKTSYLNLQAAEENISVAKKSVGS